jgi:hypothetical protein
MPVINSEPIRSQAQEPQQIIQNQETWLKAATVSMEDIGGRSTEGTFNSIQNMELKSSSTRELNQHKLKNCSEMWREAAIDS